MNLAYLTAQIQAVCPIDGVSIGRPDTKATWRIDFRPEATAQQRLDAQAVLDAYTPDSPEEVDYVQQGTVDNLNNAILRVMFNHENRIRALEARPAITLAQFRAAIKALL